MLALAFISCSSGQITGLSGTLHHTSHHLIQQDGMITHTFNLRYSHGRTPRSIEEHRPNKRKQSKPMQMTDHADASRQTNQEDTDAKAEIAVGDGFSHQQAMPATPAVWLPQFNEWPVGITSPASRRGEKQRSISSIEEVTNNVYAHAPRIGIIIHSLVSNYRLFSAFNFWVPSFFSVFRHTTYLDS